MPGLRLEYRARRATPRKRLEEQVARLRFEAERRRSLNRKLEGRIEQLEGALRQIRDATQRDSATADWMVEVARETVGDA